MVRKKRAGLATEAEPVHYSTAGFLKAQQQARDVSPIPTKTESSCEECANAWIVRHSRTTVAWMALALCRAGTGVTTPFPTVHYAFSCYSWASSGLGGVWGYHRVLVGTSTNEPPVMLDQPSPALTLLSAHMGLPWVVPRPAWRTPPSPGAAKQRRAAGG